VVGGEAFLLTELRFAIPPAYAQAGLEQPEGDVFIAAIRQSAAATDAGSTVTSCPHPIDKGATPITFDGGTHGVGERIFCPLTEPVPVAGYLMVRWSLGDVTYQAAIAGDAGPHRRVVDETIAAIRLVAPA